MAGREAVPKVEDEVPPRPVDRIVSPFQAFARLQASSAVLLVAATVAALAWANSPWGESYVALWQETTLTVGVGDLALTKPLVVWINDALMAIFFFLVGLEIKAEVLVGELRSPRRAVVPLVAAAGGLAVPAAIFVALNAGHEGVRGWGVPVATDIAFALGILALLGRRLPGALRVFLSTLAIADDLGALLVIALFYVEDLQTSYLAWAALAAGAMVALNLLHVRPATPYALVGLVLWFLILKSGVHATIAGVIGALTIPARTLVNTERFAAFTAERLREFHAAGRGGQSIVANPRQRALVQSIENACNLAQAPLQQLVTALSPWVAFAIVPVFALSNAGLRLQSLPEGESLRLALGIVLGLVVGKPLGVLLAAWLTVKTGLGTLPGGVTLRHVHGIGWLAGIGFTMSLFIANLAFGSGELLEAAKLGILVASVIAATIGLFVLRRQPAVDGSGERPDEDAAAP